MKTTTTPLQQLALRTKRLFTHDWEAKLVAIVLAFLVWYIVKDRVEMAQHSQNSASRQRVEGAVETLRLRLHASEV